MRQAGLVLQTSDYTSKRCVGEKPQQLFTWFPPNNQFNQFFMPLSIWMIPNRYVKDGCFTKHPFENGCLGYQAFHYKNPPLCTSVCLWSPKCCQSVEYLPVSRSGFHCVPNNDCFVIANLLDPLGELLKNHYPSQQIPKIHQKLNGTESQRTPKKVAIELLDSQVFSGSIQERSCWTCWRFLG